MNRPDTFCESWVGSARADGGPQIRFAVAAPLAMSRGFANGGWVLGQLNPWQRSVAVPLPKTHLPWTIFGRPYRAFSLLLSRQLEFPSGSMERRTMTMVHDPNACEYNRKGAFHESMVGPSGRRARLLRLYPEIVRADSHPLLRQRGSWSQSLATVIFICAIAAIFAKSSAAASFPWDWTGILGTGQSLSVGAKGDPVLSTNQPSHNLKLSTNDLPWPIDSDNTNLSLVPLVEPIGRLSPSYPSSWPENIAGETPHSAMANEITALVQSRFGHDYVTIHSAVGENGQGMIFLKKNAIQKGINGRSYAAALIETRAIARLAKAAGKTYGVGAIVITHGETDAGNKDYENELYQLWEDYNTDLRAITGQTQKIPMIVSQQNTCADRSASTLAQWKISVDHPADFVCSGPKYQYPSPEGVHLTARGYQMLGEKYGQVYFEKVILGNYWRPLEPVKLKRHGKIITIRYHVPVPPMVWDTTLEAPHASVAEWKNGKGFEVTASTGSKVTIASVAILGSNVVVTCASDPGPGAQVSYAMIGEKERMQTPFLGSPRWGLLRDSDPFVGAVTQQTQPNYAVAFEMRLR